MGMWLDVVVRMEINRKALFAEIGLRVQNMLIIINSTMNTIGRMYVNF